MGTTLSHGIYLPNEGERNCYAGLKLNWETLDQKVADISALQSAIAGALHREIVVSLPTTDIDTATIYMILNGTSATENVYDEYMYISNAWELIGTSATDLTNYYTKADVDGKLLLKANASDLTSHTGDTTIHVTASDKEKWDTLALIKHLRLVNAQVGSATTIPFSDFDDTNGIKVGDKCADLDVKVFEITAVDTANQTVTVTPLIDIALDANVVHTNEINSSGIGIIEAVKEVGGVDFNTLTTQGLYGANASGSTNNPEASPCVVQVIKRQNSVIQIANVTSSAYKSRYIRYCGDITVQSPVWQPWIKFATDDNVMHLTGNETVGGVKTFSDIPIFSTFDGIRFRCSHNSSAYVTFRNANQANPGSIIFSANDGNVGTAFHLVDKTLIPYTNGDIDLGTSLRKWKSINGINPGALSFPDLSNGLDISGYITVPNTSNTYTPTVDGWISIILKSTSGALACFVYQGDFANSNYSATSLPNETEPCVMCSLPVVKNVAVSIDVKGSNAYVVSAKFYPNLGNV